MGGVGLGAAGRPRQCRAERIRGVGRGQQCLLVRPGQVGDLVCDDLVLHSPYIDAVSEIGVPWYNLMGNHDMNFDVMADSLADETYEANFGPANYSFNYGFSQVTRLPKNPVAVGSS